MFGRISTAVALTAASLVGLPTAAWAITIHQENFVGSTLGTQRRPANSSNDWAMPSRSGSGSIGTDAPGTVGVYGLQLVRDIAFLPDDVVAKLTGQPFSEPYTVYTGRSWPSGNYHFDFRVTTRGTGTGFGKVGW
jgi:hypothetical protein